jgi:hypothetical protein
MAFFFSKRRFSKVVGIVADEAIFFLHRPSAVGRRPTGKTKKSVHHGDTEARKNTSRFSNLRVSVPPW